MSLPIMPKRHCQADHSRSRGATRKDRLPIVELERQNNKKSGSEQ